MKAPIEHMFGSHEWCDKEWCWAKQIEETKIEIGKKLLQYNNDEATVNGVNDVSKYVIVLFIFIRLC